jgi:hypothetical protein
MQIPAAAAQSIVHTSSHQPNQHPTHHVSLRSLRMPQHGSSCCMMPTSRCLGLASHAINCSCWSRADQSTAWRCTCYCPSGAACHCPLFKEVHFSPQLLLRSAATCCCWHCRTELLGELQRTLLASALQLAATWLLSCPPQHTPKAWCILPHNLNKLSTKQLCHQQDIIE